MKRLKEVEEATALMQEAAANWSVMRWLAEKKRVRKTADRANDALDELDRKVKASWCNELKAAYAELSSAVAKSERQPTPKNGNNAATIAPEIKLFAKQVKQSDEEAYRARMDAEDTFDVAEKRLSTRMAREGAQKAITSWELHEKAIAKAQAGMSSTSTAS
jgi:hypothetical protein